MIEITNEFTNFLETHYEIVAEIERLRNSENSEIVNKICQKDGLGGCYELAMKLTIEFENTYKDTDWGNVLEYFDTIEQFLKQELK